MKSTGRIVLGIACASIGIGIAILLLGTLFSGGSVRNQHNTFSYQDEVKDVTSINLDIDFAKVRILEGDTFHVDVKNTTEDGLHSEVRNGVWYLEDKFDDRYSMNFFGLRLPVNFNGFSFRSEVDLYPTITITLPEGFKADEFNIEFGAGELLTDNIDAESVNISLGAGDMTIKKLTVEKDSRFSVGAGSMKINRLTAKDVTLKSGVGEISVNGEIYGDSDVDCGVGEINLNLEGDEKDYNYIVDCGIGSVKINNRNWDFTAHESIYNDNTKGTFKLKCGIGSITLKIR
ncbi:DUF4097 family beta strand repeat-containing protein [Lachnoclostridium phytofermentans]|uniref:DUF4097 domain-containing protein n=1 Tax=Lachnoclostridium phytofermentans (strain ATCC 700394 / DSM 18823 / ISDg) TaxID=357809 RepID=A9KNP9_LACP7|nr:DUF4097 family beta strand repeat-containing protein [Lachnoclostridium phytofermentans]ABX41650.1 hypothetical protein Cphy_1272 [Lachnoclostridium phytofermentans ISDg]